MATPTEQEKVLALAQYRWCREALCELPLAACIRARTVLAGVVVSALQGGSTARAYSVVRSIEYLDSLRPVAQRWHDADAAAAAQAAESRALAARQEVKSEEIRLAGRSSVKAFCMNCNHWGIEWCPTRLQYECDHCGATDVVPRWVTTRAEPVPGQEAVAGVAYIVGDGGL